MYKCLAIQQYSTPYKFAIPYVKLWRWVDRKNCGNTSFFVFSSFRNLVRALKPDPTLDSVRGKIYFKVSPGAAWCPLAICHMVSTEVTRRINWGNVTYVTAWVTLPSRYSTPSVYHPDLWQLHVAPKWHSSGIICHCSVSLDSGSSTGTRNSGDYESLKWFGVEKQNSLCRLHRQWAAWSGGSLNVPISRV